MRSLSLETSVEVYTAERLSLFDRMLIRPASYPYQHLGLWAARPHLLTMCLLQATHPSPTWLQTVQSELATSPALVGLSQLGDTQVSSPASSPMRMRL